MIHVLLIVHVGALEKKWVTKMLCTCHYRAVQRTEVHVARTKGASPYHLPWRRHQGEVCLADVSGPYGSKPQ